jgi:nitrite reductase (NADH) small subunit
LRGFVKITDIEQISESEPYVTVVAGYEIAIFRHDGGYYAVENCCPHRGGPIAEGEIKNGIVSCPWHAWPFDVRTGECTINSAAKLKTFKLRIENGQVFVAFDVER